MATASGGLRPPDPLLPQILYSGQPPSHQLPPPPLALIDATIVYS